MLASNLQAFFGLSSLSAEITATHTHTFFIFSPPFQSHFLSIGPVLLRELCHALWLTSSCVRKQSHRSQVKPTYSPGLRFQPQIPEAGRWEALRFQSWILFTQLQIDEDWQLSATTWVSTRQPSGDSGWQKGRYSWNHSLHFLNSAFIFCLIIFIWVWLQVRMCHGVFMGSLWTTPRSWSSPSTLLWGSCFSCVVWLRLADPPPLRWSSCLHLPSCYWNAGDTGLRFLVDFGHWTV